MVRQPGQVSYYILYDVLYPVNNTISGQWSREHGGAPESRRHGRLRLPEQPQGLQLDGGVLRGQGDDDANDDDDDAKDDDDNDDNDVGNDDDDDDGNDDDDGV